MHKNISSRAYVPALILLAIFAAYIGVVNYLIPLFADDLCRAYHDFSLMRAFKAAAKQYMRWSGRYPVMFANYLFFSGNGSGVVILAILNGVIYTLLGGFLLVRLGARSLMGNLVWVIIFSALLWFATRVFGEAILWKTGSVQYLWGVALACVCLLPLVRCSLDLNSSSIGRFKMIGYVLLCFLGGMWLEHISVAVAVVGALLFIGVHFIRGGRWPLWAKAGYLSWVVGTAVLIIAPGNYARIEVVGRQEPMLNKLFGVTTHLLYHFDTLVLITIIVFLVIAILTRPADIIDRLVIFAAFIATGVLCAYATLGAPVMVFNGRVAFPSQFFFIVAAMALFPSNLFTYDGLRVATFTRRILITACALVLTVLVFDARNVFIGYQQIHDQDLARQQRIAEALERGEGDLTISALYFSKRVNTRGGEVNLGRRFARDITRNPKHFANTCFARYYGLSSVVLGRPKTGS
ncbi:MAG: hypothetical protein DHS20C01_09000 [marine bacterium B5-7]|nr:MAG: hypothetical protein DHS20C01_09000 [marine bacterium B5-7]